MIGLRDVLVVAPAASFHPQHHHHHHHHADGAAAPLLSPADHPIIPLLTAAPCGLPEDPDRAARLNLWQNQPAPPPVAWGNLQQSPFPGAGSGGAGPSSYLCKPMPVPVLDSASTTTSMGGVLGGGGGGKGLMAMGVAGVGDGLSSPFTTCQDCGNKAKKDCVHRRCRTCCKSRGFDCSTHLKSTWVPAAHRRERQVSSSAPSAAGPAGMGSSASNSGAKKPRLVSASNDQTATTNTTSTSNTTPPRSFDTSSSHQDAEFRQSLPGQVTAPAVFKCVRVTTVDDGEDEYAYQAVVNIGGHVFKGFLYDQGVEGDQGDATAHTSSHSGGDHQYNTADGGGRGSNAAGTANRSRPSTIPNISELHLGGGGGGVPSDVFGAALGGGGGLIGGTAFGNPID